MERAHGVSHKDASDPDVAKSPTRSATTPHTERAAGRQRQTTGIEPMLPDLCASNAKKPRGWVAKPDKGCLTNAWPTPLGAVVHQQTEGDEADIGRDFRRACGHCKGTAQHGLTSVLRHTTPMDQELLTQSQYSASMRRMGPRAAGAQRGNASATPSACATDPE